MKKLTSLILVAILLITTAAPAYAAAPETVVPFYANTSQASITFVIDENGAASWTISCIGKSNCTGIDAVTYLERSFAGTWIRVFIGNGNDEFTYSTSESRMVQTYELQLRNHDTYRAVVVFTVYGTEETETFTYHATRTFN